MTTRFHFERGLRLASLNAAPQENRRGIRKPWTTAETRGSSNSTVEIALPRHRWRPSSVDRHHGSSSRIEECSGSRFINFRTISADELQPQLRCSSSELGNSSTRVLTIARSDERTTFGLRASRATQDDATLSYKPLPVLRRSHGSVVCPGKLQDHLVMDISAPPDVRHKMPRSFL